MQRAHAVKVNVIYFRWVLSDKTANISPKTENKMILISVSPRTVAAKRRIKHSETKLQYVICVGCLIMR